MVRRRCRCGGAPSDPSTSRIRTPIFMARAPSVIFSQSTSQWATFPHKASFLQFPNSRRSHTSITAESSTRPTTAHRSPNIGQPNENIITCLAKSHAPTYVRAVPQVMLATRAFRLELHLLLCRSITKNGTATSAMRNLEIQIAPTAQWPNYLVPLD
jgi:hypothetical protein